MSEKCEICGTCFVLGDEFYSANKVILTKDGFIKELPFEDNKYICEECLEV
jgi:hypothetical protein